MGYLFVERLQGPSYLSYVEEWEKYLAADRDGLQRRGQVYFYDDDDDVEDMLGE